MQSAVNLVECAVNARCFSRLNKHKQTCTGISAWHYLVRALGPFQNASAWIAFHAFTALTACLGVKIC